MSLPNGQKAFSLIEVLVSLAIFGVIGVVLLNGLITGNKGLVVSQESVVAEGLAKSQVEYIKSQEYISVGDHANRYDLVDIPAHLASAGYAVEVSVSDNAVALAGRAGFELESITTKVKRYGSTKLAITFYRVGLAF